MIKRLMWPGILFVLIGSVVAVDVTMLIVSLDDKSFAVAASYEGHGGTPYDSIKQERENVRLGWNVETDVRWLDEETVEIRVSVADAAGSTLDHPTATLQAFHKARAANVIDVPLSLQDDGTFLGTLKVRRLGHWEMRVTIVRGSDVFTSMRDHVIDADTARAGP